jgi:asparagine synthase (glutamine-hydrolysing)
MCLMSRYIKSMGIKMVLSGEGADEMFGGYLYFHKCPNAAELQRETVRKLKSLYKFDCLRANKSTAAFGVEARVPFLDKLFLDFTMGSINPQDKMCGEFASPKGRIEKWLVREAFNGYLPDEILWRQKEQFSDGVGYGWIDSIKAEAEKCVTDSDFAVAVHRFPHNTPLTKEAFYIRSVFEQTFPQPSARMCVPGGPSIACSTAAALDWDASFKKFADCSGRSVAGVHEAAYDSKRRELAKGEVIGEASSSVVGLSPATTAST